MIARDIAGVAVAHEIRRVREPMPNARTRPIGQRRSFDLVGGRRAAPQKIGREFDRFRHG